jgi:hypothetical protein
MRYLLLSIVILSLVCSCSDDDIDTTTKIYTQEEITKIRDYHNFLDFKNSYMPLEWYIDSINTEMQENIDPPRFIFYFDVDCGCVGSMREIAQMLKILEESQVHDSLITLYGMGTKTQPYPEQDLYIINSLPAEFTIGEESTFSLFDTLRIWQHFEPGRTFSKEELILKSIRNTNKKES